ncbi:MAG: hypothetical protein Q9195_003782 [Heterodermia aff. obscurata]
MENTAQGSEGVSNNSGSEDNGPRNPDRLLTVPPTPRLAFSILNTTAQGSGYVSDNSGSVNNGGVSANFNFQNAGGASTGVNNTGGASTSVNTQGNEGVSMHIEPQDIGIANMNDNTQSYASTVMKLAEDDEQGAPHGIQLPVNHQSPVAHPFTHHRVHVGRGLRRMTSTPVLPSRPMYNPAPGVGPVHRPVHMPSHPAAITPIVPAPDIDPDTDEVNEFLNTLKIMILEAVQVNRYKNGLFVTSITPRTDLVHDMNIMINSAQVTGLDNMRLQNVRAAVEEIKRRVAAGDKIGVTVLGKRMTIYDFYGVNVHELRDLLLSRDKHEHARWLKYYGGGGNDDNDGNDGASGSAVV